MKRKSFFRIIVLFAGIMILICAQSGLVYAGAADSNTALSSTTTAGSDTGMSSTTDADSDIDYSSFPDPASSRIGVMTGSINENLVRERYPNATILSFDNKNEILMALGAGKIDYAIDARTYLYNYMNSNPGKIIIIPKELKKQQSAIVINKNNEELLSDFNSVITKFKNDGTLNRLVNNWIHYDGIDYVRDEIPVRSSGPVLKVAVSATDEPLIFVENGRIVGLDAELIQRIAYELGMRVQFDDMKFSSMIPSVLSGKDQVALSDITVTEERKKAVNFTIPYYDNDMVMAARNPALDAGTGGTGAEGFFAGIKKSLYSNFIMEDRWKLMVSGIGVTFLLSVLSGIIGFAVGLLFCIMRISRSKAVNGITIVVTRIFQGTPIVIILMIFYYIVFAGTGLNGIEVAVIAFSLNFGAYSSEIMLSGIKAVDPGQEEAALAIGFTPAQTFLGIVFPQAAGHFLPVLRGELISLVKSTSIVGYIAVQDMTKVSDIIRSRTYEAFFPLIITAVIYFLLSFGLASLLDIISSRIDKKHRSKKIEGIS